MKIDIKNFTNKHYETQQICGSCFWSEKCNSTLPREETSEHESNNVAAILCLIVNNIADTNRFPNNEEIFLFSVRFEFLFLMHF